MNIMNIIYILLVEKCFDLVGFVVVIVMVMVMGCSVLSSISRIIVVIVISSLFVDLLVDCNCKFA